MEQEGRKKTTQFSNCFHFQCGTRRERKKISRTCEYVCKKQTRSSFPKKYRPSSIALVMRQKIYHVFRLFRGNETHGYVYIILNNIYLFCFLSSYALANDVRSIGKFGAISIKLARGKPVLFTNTTVYNIECA